MTSVRHVDVYQWERAFLRGWGAVVRRPAGVGRAWASCLSWLAPRLPCEEEIYI